MNVTAAAGRVGASDIGLYSRYVAYINMAVRVGDVLIVAASACLAWALRFGTDPVDFRYRVVIGIGILLTLLVFPAFKLYGSWRGEKLTTEIARAWLAWVAVLLTTLAFGWVFKSTAQYSRLWFGLWASGAATLFVIHRVGGRFTLRLIRARGIDTRRILLVGATHAGSRIVEATRANPWMGLHVIGYIATPYDQLGMADLPRLGDLDTLLANHERIACDQLWIALPMAAEQDILRINRQLNNSAITVRFVPDLFGYELLNQRTGQIAGLPVITLRGSRITGYARLAKSIEDRTLAVLILVLISPLMVLLAAGVKLSSPGPVLFKQRRLGIGGKAVEVWKFRSMRVHAEANGVVTQCKHDDPRTTGFGRFIRRFSLDELPQFLNVAMGSMSIVGPRPHAIEHDYFYRSLIHGYAQRQHVKPGITGWAQVNGLRGETNTLGKMSDRVEYDMTYIRNWSLWFDLRIIATTVAIVFLGKNAY